MNVGAGVIGLSGLFIILWALAGINPLLSWIAAGGVLIITASILTMDSRN